MINETKFQKHLDSLSIAGIGQWINDHDPRRKTNPLKTLKCRRSNAVSMAVEMFTHVRANRNKRQYRKASRGILRYAN